MEIMSVLEELLPINSPFYVVKVDKAETEQEVHIHLEIDDTYRPNETSGGIHQYYTRKWEHLKLFQYRCFIHCRLPVYKNKLTGKTEALKVEFSRPKSRFTLLYFMKKK